MMEERPFDLIVTDLKMSSIGGMEVLNRVKERHPETLAVVMTGYASVSSAVEVMKTGAFDYLPKPFTPDEFRSVVKKALAEAEMLRQDRRLRGEGKPQRQQLVHQLIGNSPQIQKVVEMVRKVAPTDSTVLISGESGTGKELIARAIHANSRRSDKVFFAVDCGTLSGELLESELFGHVKGAFTGAHETKAGIFSRADAGTVFLDEISNVSTQVQAKLLRFLESRTFLPRGGATQREVDVRLIFATNQDLESLVTAGAFRQDFYYRIFVYPIMLPPLRERKKDILPIAYHFLAQFNRSLNKRITGFDPEAIKALYDYDWPGNVRQLRNTVERAVILCESELIGPGELLAAGDLGELNAGTPTTNEELKRVKKELRRRAVAKVEKNFVVEALIRSNWNVTRAARQTGMQRSNFQSLMKKHGVRPRKPSPGAHPPADDPAAKP
jgi:DNA-binding NtrC family response regulator